MNIRSLPLLLACYYYLLFCSVKDADVLLKKKNKTKKKNKKTNKKKKKKKSSLLKSLICCKCVLAEMKTSLLINVNINFFSASEYENAKYCFFFIFISRQFHAQPN